MKAKKRVVLDVYGTLRRLKSLVTGSWVVPRKFSSLAFCRGFFYAHADAQEILKTKRGNDRRQ